MTNNLPLSNENFNKELQVPNVFDKNKKLKSTTKDGNTTGLFSSFKNKLKTINDENEEPSCAEIIEDLDLIASIIERCGAPDKITLNCTLEYDSEDTKKAKTFIIKR